MNVPQKFFTVYAYLVSNEDWTIEGIFSKEFDAEARRVELEAHELVVDGSTNVQLLPMDVVIEELVSNRLGKMATVLMPLEHWLKSCRDPEGAPDVPAPVGPLPPVEDIG